MSATLHLLITLAICLAVAPPLTTARWTWRSPRTGILLWQLLGLTVVLCVIAMAGAAGPVIAGVLAVWLGAEWVNTLRIRRRHRRLLALVAREDAAAPGALVLDHPVTVAYCLPGLRSRVVLSSGALRNLDDHELAAVLAHERAHLRERHDLVLLPFTALQRLLPASRRIREAVGLLVEMRADENACPRSLATALHRFTAKVPPGALGAGDAEVRARLLRLAGKPLPRVVRWLVLAAGLVLVSTPLSFFVW